MRFMAPHSILIEIGAINDEHAIEMTHKLSICVISARKHTKLT